MNTKFIKMQDTITELRNRPIYDDKMLLSEVQFSRQNMMLEKSKRIGDSLYMEVLKEDWNLKEQKLHRDIRNIQVLALIFSVIVVFLR
jgi:hypothetical protein